MSVIFASQPYWAFVAFCCIYLLLACYVANVANTSKQYIITRRCNYILTTDWRPPTEWLTSHLEISNDNISTTGHPIHFMFGSRVRFWAIPFQSWVIFFETQCSYLCSWSCRHFQAAGKHVTSRLFTMFWDHYFNPFQSLTLCPVLARERCWVSPPRFLAECRKKQLNQASFVLVYFALFFFLGCI